MELQDYVAILRKRWVSIGLVALVALAAAVGVTLVATPTYEARAQVFVSVRTGGTTSDLLQGSSFTQKQVKSYTDLVTSPRVLIPVIENLDLATTPDELARTITANNPLDTVLINITATDVDPQQAADVANATAESLATEVTALEKPEDGPSPVQISSVRAAAAPVDPASPNARLNLALGLLAGLGFGFGVALLREILDTRVRTQADVGKVTSTSVVATIVHDDDATRSPLLSPANPHSQRAESFRRLRTNLQFLDVTDDLQTMVVTSSLPGEGKSTTAINLAITLADAGTRVLLVDADLRRPSVARYLGLEGTVGLTTVLIGRAAVEDVVQPWGTAQLDVLPSGQIPPNPSELLGSRTMAELLASVSARYDVVIIDTPPLLPVTDAAILARLTGGAIVVVGAHAVHQQELTQSLGALETVGARVLGVVLNRVPAKQAGSYAYYDYAPLEPTSEAPQSRRMSARTARKALEVEPPSRGRGPRDPEADPVGFAEPSAVSVGQRDALATSGTGGSLWPGGPLGPDRD